MFITSKVFEAPIYTTMCNATGDTHTHIKTERPVTLN